MSLKAYFVQEIKEDSDGNTTVRVKYRAAQTGTPTNANPTGFTGTLAVAPVAEDLDPSDGSGFKTVLLSYTGSPTINTAYLDNETSFVRN